MSLYNKKHFNVGYIVGILFIIPLVSLALSADDTGFELYPDPDLNANYSDLDQYEGDDYWSTDNFDLDTYDFDDTHWSDFDWDDSLWSDYDSDALPTADINTNVNTNTTNTVTNTADVSADESATVNTSSTSTGKNCQTHCAKFLRGKSNAVLLSAEGDHPDCRCQIDVVDNLNRITQTISTDGDDETTYTFDPDTGGLIKKVKINRADEVEKVRIRLGYRYTEDEIDELLADDKINSWFNSQIKDIETETDMWNPQFWWQHIVSIWDHGTNGNSADFVDTYNFGRCGDSMQWLERDLKDNLDIGKDPDRLGRVHEAMLSITGEKWSNNLNHTSLLIRPAGISNIEWDDMVKELKRLSGGTKDNPGIPPDELQNVDLRLLDAKVLDSYKKEITTVRDFVKGWSYIRIS